MHVCPVCSQPAPWSASVAVCPGGYCPPWSCRSVPFVGRPAPTCPPGRYPKERRRETCPPRHSTIASRPVTSEAVLPNLRDRLPWGSAPPRAPGRALALALRAAVLSNWRSVHPPSYRRRHSSLSSAPPSGTRRGTSSCWSSTMTASSDFAFRGASVNRAEAKGGSESAGGTEPHSRNGCGEQAPRSRRKTTQAGGSNGGDRGQIPMRRQR